MTEKDPSLNLGAKLRKIRQSKKLSLAVAAELTGVSKAMLGQIERGDSVPTISTLWKISTGLKVSFAEILNNETTISDVVNISSMKPQLSDSGDMKLYDVFPFDATEGMEYFYIVMNPGAVSHSEPHRSGSREFVLVIEGTLHMNIDGIEKVLIAPAAISFDADVDHEYQNRTNENVAFQDIVKY